MAKKNHDRSTDIAGTIAEKISELVALGVYPPGLQLQQVELAEKFSVSRVPVREALKRLAAEGIVEHDLNRGFFVAQLSSDEARQLYRIRHLVEGEVLASIEWPSPTQLAALEKETDRLEALMKSGKHAQWAIAHRELMRKIFELSSQKVLVREALRLLSLTDRYRSLAPPPQRDARNVASEQHVLKALAARDRARLLRVFDEDRTRIEEQLIGSLVARGM
ncbi:MAG TPA: GntR family transcriptional regulator [Steroidobacteraceae bacterium]|nr:GntR family transcriptional regulator [Steroidobacteraceae bacterium]